MATEAGDGGLFVGRVRTDGVGGAVGVVLGVLGVLVVPGSRVVVLCSFMFVREFGCLLQNSLLSMLQAFVWR